ncbi:MAG: LamG domain-containing protein [Phycisphaerae bacterium]|nr:LamG domain-containing protein [Phycisphaerae bacterium]
MKKLVTLTMLVAIAAMASSAQAELVGYWKMDDNLNDSSGNGHNGTYNGTGTAGYVAGELDNALDLPGTDQYVSVADHADWDTGDSITVSLWFKTDNSTQSDQALLVHDASEFKYIVHLADHQNLDFYLRFSSGVRGVYCDLSGSDSFADNQWHHVLATFDRSLSSNREKLYVDGTMVYQRDAYNEAILAGDEGIELGKWGSNYFAGQIDDAGIFSQGLTSGEAKAVNDVAAHTLNYDLGESEQLFDLHSAGSGTATVDGRLWSYATGLTTTLGVVTQVGSDYHLRLDNSGSGVTTPVPEPATMTLLMLGLPLALRRRRK